MKSFSLFFLSVLCSPLSYSDGVINDFDSLLEKYSEKKHFKISLDYKSCVPDINLSFPDRYFNVYSRTFFPDSTWYTEEKETNKSMIAFTMNESFTEGTKEFIPVYVNEDIVVVAEKDGVRILISRDKEKSYSLDCQWNALSLSWYD